MNIRILFLCLSFIISNMLYAQKAFDYEKNTNSMLHYYNQQNFDKAIVYAEKGRQQAEIDGLDSFYIDYVSTLAFFYKKKGDYQEAEAHYIETNRRIEAFFGKENNVYATYVSDLALLYELIGKYDLALSLHMEAKDIRAKVLGKEHPDFATSLNNIAMLYQKTGHYEQAIPLLIQTINIDAKTLGKEHPDYATSLNNLALLYENLKRYPEAEPLFIQAKEIWETSLGNKSVYYAYSLNNLAHLYLGMKQYKKALPLFIQAKTRWLDLTNDKHPKYALALNNLALVYKRLGRRKEALPLFLEAANIRRTVLGNHHKDLAVSLNNIARIYQENQQWQQAWDYIAQALTAASGTTISCDTINKQWAYKLVSAKYASLAHLRQTLNILDLADIILRKKNGPNTTNQRLVVADLATNLLDQWRNSHHDEKDKLRVLSTSSKWMVKSLNLHDNKTDIKRAFALAERNKSVLLLQASKSEKAYRIGNLPDSLVEQESQLFKEKDRYQAMLMEKRPKIEKDSLNDLLNRVNQDITSFIRRISKKYPLYSKTKYQASEVDPSMVQKLLPPNTALIEYVVGDSLLHIFCIDQKQTQWEKVSLNYEQMVQKIRSLHDILSDYQKVSTESSESYHQFTFLAHWFYKKLLAPVLSNDQIKNLIIVPHGELGHLPFEAFLASEAPQVKTHYKQLDYLLNHYSISYNYSATLWKENKESPAHTNNGQVFGVASNYEIELDSTAAKLRLATYLERRDKLCLLPEARKEIELLSQKYSGLFLFDKNASEKAFKRQAGDYAIIHLAMHGLLEKQQPILSSLVFTEDGDSSENNFLHAYEISKMELNADLVVLSACQTGYGRFEKGNGIASLARAFMYAGASSLIVTLWQVNDAASSHIMKRVYQNLASGTNKAEALRLAKLDFIQNSQALAAHPAFWSPFIQIGNNAPLHISKRRAYWYWIIGALGCSILGFLILMRRKKEA